MVFILDGNSEYDAHSWKKIGLFGEEISTGDCSRSNQMPWIYHITKIAPSELPSKYHGKICTLFPIRPLLQKITFYIWPAGMKT